MKQFLHKLFAPIDLTRGSIFKGLVKFTLPIIFSYLFQQIYSITDGIIVGQNLTSSQVNGINDTSSISFIVLMFAQGCTVGFSVVTAKLFGKKDEAGMRRSFFVQLILSLILSIVMTAITLSCLNPLLSMIGLNKETGGDTYISAYRYCFTMFSGLFTIVFYNQVMCFLRSIGDSIMPLIFLIIASILNIILDIIFIVPLALGVVGAGLTTIISQGISALSCYVYMFFKYKNLRIRKEDTKAGVKDYLEHLRLGLPLGFQFSVLAFGLISLQSAIYKFDTLSDGTLSADPSAQLAYGACCKVINFLMAPINALGTAMLSFCAQNKGAGDEKRIKKGIKQSLIIALVLCLSATAISMLLLIDDTLLKIFYPLDKITKRTSYLTRIYIFTEMPLFYILGLLFIFRNSVQGVGNSLFPFLGGIGELIGRILCSSFLPYAFTKTISYELDLVQNPWPFVAVSLSDAIGWTIGVLFLSVGMYLYIYRTKKNKLPDIQK